MKTPRQLLLIAALAATPVSCGVVAARPQLQIQGEAVQWGGSCESGLTVLAGSRFFLTLENELDQPLVPLDRGWPEGYEIEAALDIDPVGEFISTPGLVERLGLTSFIGWDNIGANNTLLEQGPDSTIPSELNRRHFIMTFPPDLVGHRLSFRARYRRDGVELVSRVTLPIAVIRPCDRADSARIVASHIYEATVGLHYSRAVELADSLLAVGLTDAMAWQWADVAARGSGNFDKAIAYLDRLWEDFGLVEVADRQALSRVAADAVRDPQMHEIYLQRRGILLQAKAEQEQQQR